MNIFNKEKIYQQSKQRWQNAQANLVGIMDGFDYVNEIDLIDSCATIKNLIIKENISTNYAIDCAAGIGRVSEQILTKYFTNIDLLEQDKKFIEFCQKNFAQNPQVKNIFCDSLQNFQFNSLYDTFWIQWGLENLDEKDSINFLIKCKNNLTKNGVIILKENISPEEYIDIDNGIILRSYQGFADIFVKCNLQIIEQKFIDNWPEGLLPVCTFILR